MLLRMRVFLPSERPSSLLWKKLMGAVALASFLGFALHIYPWEPVPLVCIWVVLYAVLLEALHAFLLLSISTASGGDRPRRKDTMLLRVIELVMLAALTVILLLRRNPIRVFILCGIALAAPAFFSFTRLALRGHRGSRILLASLLPQIPGLVLQLMRRGEIALWNLDFNGIYHLCLLVSIVIFYFAARSWSK